MSERLSLGASPFGGHCMTGEEVRARFGLTDAEIDIRARCIEDPLFLGAEVIQHDRLPLFRSPCKEHVEASRAMIDQTDFMLLLPRGHLKTTLVDEIGTIWQLLKYPNDRLLLMQASLENAKAIAGQIRHHFMRNKVLRALFPEYAIDSREEEGAVMRFSVPCKTIVTRESSVEIGTPGASLSGRHYDVIAGSDLMNEQNTPPPCGNSTVEEMEKVKAWYATADGLLETKMANPRAHKRIDGTFWSDADLYKKIIEDDRHGHWRKIVAGITRKDGGGWVPVWDLFTEEMIREKYESPTMTPALWAANYAMDPQPESGSMRFLREWIRYYEDVPKNLNVAITVDPAWTEAKKARSGKSDRSAVVVTGIDPRGRLYVLDAVAGRWGVNELVETVFEKAMFWKPEWVGFEQDDKGLKSIWFMEMQRTKRFFIYKSLKPGTTDKVRRAAPLNNLIQHWGLYVRRGLHDALVEELLRFPVGKHDDYVDALAYRAHDVFVPHDESEIRKAPLPSRVAPSGYLTSDELLDGVARRERLRAEPHLRLLGA